MPSKSSRFLWFLQSHSPFQHPKENTHLLKEIQHIQHPRDSVQLAERRMKMANDTFVKPSGHVKSPQNEHPPESTCSKVQFTTIFHHISTYFNSPKDMKGHPTTLGPQVAPPCLAFISPAAAPRAVSASKKPLPVATRRQGFREVSRASWPQRWRKLIRNLGFEP